MSCGEYRIALAGCPNVGKSTVFNRLTGLRQHTGNWAGKTVETARGVYWHNGEHYTVTDLPGLYSLEAASAEERVSCLHLQQAQNDAVVVVADATSLARSLYLVLSLRECCPRVLLCVNLLDEAKKKHIRIDLPQLAQALGLPVVGTAARGGRGIAQLKTEIARLCQQKPAVPPAVPSATPPTKAGESTGATENMETEAHAAQLLQRAAEIAAQVTVVDPLPHNHDLQLDRLLTSRAAGIPAMLLLLALVLWITIRGANYPSALLSSWFHQLEAAFSAFLLRLAAPEWLRAMLAEGMLRSLGWVVAVMLPPMAIFFPLFTLLEDSGYLPRVAFNLDHCFRRCGAHGKQALTMCMGFGCNACGVTGCRIIESPRERLIAMLTNSFVPCNGRFPTLILLASIFFFPAGGSGAQLGAAFLLTALITGSIALSLAFSWLLSHSLLRGLPSSFVLELPPYRKPQVGQVILRSLLDRALFVLGRAVLVAAPAGLLIWLLANITAGDASLLAHLTRWLDPLGRLLGLDGVILLAFLLGLPANELVLPLALMGYLAGGSLAELGSLAQLREVLVANGWTWLTALCTMLFSLFHFPCATTLLTIRKESGSTKWMLAAFLLPTIAGVFLCMLTAQLGRLFLT